MTLARHEAAVNRFNHGDFEGALNAFLKATRLDANDWNAWYWAGQCERFRERFDPAIEYLKRAEALAPQEKCVFLALGIALQLDGRYDEAMVAFVDAIRLDEDYALAFNSLALTQRKIDEYDAALENYERGMKAVARSFARRIVNERSAVIYKYEDVVGSKWQECAAFAGLFHVCAVVPADRVAWPTGDTAEEEERTERHGGLLFVDREGGDGTTRLFLPNFFNTFREYLSSDSIFAHLVGNQGEVYRRRGEAALAEDRFAEAEHFMQRYHRWRFSRPTVLGS